MIIAIVAHDNQFLIGKNGSLPWHVPEDLALFKQTTLNHALVMGRKTMQSLKKPLPNRFTYVLSNNPNYDYIHKNVEVIRDIEPLIERYKESEDILFVCGGAEIYRLFLPYCSAIYASVMREDYEGDTYLIDYTKEGFVEDLVIEYPDFEFRIYEREVKS